MGEGWPAHHPEEKEMKPHVRIYATGVCPYCVRAEQLLRNKGVTEFEKIRIDLDPERRNEMMQITGRRTVPQIFIGERHIGGFDDLYALDREGELDTLLQNPNNP